MDALAILIPPVIALLVIAFWAWMFNDMLHNNDVPSMDPGGLRWPPTAKNHWLVFFIVLSIFTAGYYYFTVYRER